MPQRAEFYPPRRSAALMRLANAALPFALRRWCGVESVDLPEGDRERLVRATTGRCIVTPNHPSRVEPMIVAELARRIGRSFYFISARENFEGLHGPLLQGLGAYSIARGAPDRTSIAATRALLAEQDSQVVLFPEGEVYHHNDLMLPLNGGVAQIGFWALTDIVKLGKAPALPVLPVAVKYRFLADESASIEHRIRKLEDAVGTDGGGLALRERVNAIGERIVAALEGRYRLTTHAGDLSARIQRLKETILARCCAILGVEPRATGQSTAEQMRALFNAAREFQMEVEEPATDYERRLQAQRAVQYRLAVADLSRIHDSIAVTGRYVSDHPTYERLGDVLGRIEDEVFGRHARYPRRQALARVAEPLDLGALRDEYAKNKRETVALATAQVAGRLAEQLAALADVGSPIPERQWPREPDHSPTLADTDRRLE